MADFSVTVERVELFPHPKADRLQIAKVGMFSLVVGAGQYTDGDLVVFAPKRAVLPEEIRENYKNEETGVSYLRRGAIVRSIRLRGELSEGVLLNKAWVAEKYAQNAGHDNFSVDDLSTIVGVDLSEIVGIREDIPNIPKELTGVQSNIRATRYSTHDVEGIRIHQREFEVGEAVVVSEKVHGSQINVIVHEDGFVEIGSKGLIKKGIVLEQSETNTYWKAWESSGLSAIKDKYFSKKFIQFFGEIVPVQKGFSYGYETPSLLLFRIEVDGVRYNPVSLTRDYPEAAAEILTKWVPYSTDVFSIDVLEKLSKGLEGVSGKKLHIREGVVVEPVEPRLSKRGNFPLYLKVINPKYKDDDESLS